MAITLKQIERSDFYGNVIGEPIRNIPEPTSYKWAKQDISGQEAGRVMSTNAWKNKKSEARTLELTWTNRDFATVAKAFQCFQAEYIWLTYMDALTGKYERKHFYMGDMNADMYNAVVLGGIWSSASVKCIQAITDKVR